MVASLFYMLQDSFTQNILGVASLVGDDVNKVSDSSELEEGIDGDLEDALDLPMQDSELIALRDEWESKSNAYLPKIVVRQKRNRAYVRGVQRNMTTQDERVVPSNLIFEATATFVPQALAENPEPVVFSDNTDEGKAASNDLKTMLQFHADVLCLRKKLGMMVWHWGIYFTGVVKHGWDAKINDITTEIRKPQNFVLDPDGYIDEFGDYKGAFLGERMETSAKKLVEKYPEHETYITLKVNGKMGTKVVYTEWWTDEYCFSTYQDIVLDKHKNEFFNYESTNEAGMPAINHFAIPKMPYTFLSVFSLQEEPYDFTNLVEQNISNQDRINDRDDQISKNLASANNSVVLSGVSFTSETAGQAVQSFYEEGFLLVPDGNVDGAVKRIPANEIPQSVFTAQSNDKDNLRSIYGTLGLSAQKQTEDTTARGQILNQSHDSSRIGGGVGDALEQVADNIFNWWVQLYCVFYDEKHYAAVMGTGRAVEYVNLTSQDLVRKFVVSVAPNSMAPKDEISEINQAIQLYEAKALDPISLFKKLDYPDPMATAKQVVLWTTNPQQYAAQFFPEIMPQQQPQNGIGMPQQEGTPAPTLAQPAASSALSNVPIATTSMPQ